MISKPRDSPWELSGDCLRILRKSGGHIDNCAIFLLPRASAGNPSLVPRVQAKLPEAGYLDLPVEPPAGLVAGNPRLRPLY